MKNYRRILIKKNNKLYKFVNYSLSDKDGSLFLSLLRRGKSDKNWTYCVDFNNNVTYDLFQNNVKVTNGYEISYHASGFIHYKKTKNKSIYGEPIYNITKPFSFALYSIPNIESLDKFEKKINEDNDFIVEINNKKISRLNFIFTITPWSYEPPKNNYLGFSLHFNNLFSLNIRIDSNKKIIPKTLESTFTFMTPKVGLFDKLYIDEKIALMKFHQVTNNTQKMILYSPNNEGIYKIIFSVPKRIKPIVNIEFYDKNLGIEIIKNEITYTMFIVKDKYGNTVKDEKKIYSIELDARPSLDGLNKM